MITETLKTIVAAFNIILTFGDKEIKDSKEKVDALIRELSLSLQSAHYLTDKIVRLNKRLPELSDGDFVREFNSLRDDYNALLTDPVKMSNSRTHCSRVAEHLSGIRTRLGYYARTNVDDWGEWVKVRETLWGIISDDNKIIDDYGATFGSLQKDFARVDELLNGGGGGPATSGSVTQARSEFGGLAQKLSGDYKELREGIERMNAAKEHINKF